MQGFKGILLDLDNTLYTYSQAHDPALETTLAHMQQVLNIEISELYALYKQARHRIHTILKGTASCHNRLLYFQTIMELLNLKPFGLPYQLYQLYWNTFLEHMQLLPGVIDFLSSLEGTPICLVTDMTADIQHQKVIHLGIEPFVQHMVTSEEAGSEKPHPKIFQCALKKLGLSPSEVCMIGDGYEKDVLGAMGMGISAYWYRADNRGEQIEETGIGYTCFSDFHELLRHPLLPRERHAFL